MSDLHAGKKITADEYFERQKDAELICKRNLKRLIIQSVVFLSVLMFLLIMLEFHTGSFIYSGFIIVWCLLIFICFSMFIGSLFLIRKEIRKYKFSLKRIEEYMLSGGIVIEVPKEDYEKFDIIKSRKEKFKAKSIYGMQIDEKKKEIEKQKELEQKEYEKRVEEEFQKQFYSDEK